jgi:hypothetical protein
VNDRAMKMGIWTVALAISLVAVKGGAQTGGQMKAAQSLANQAKSGSSSSAPAGAPRTSAPAKSPRTGGASAKAPSTPKTSKAPAAQASRAATAGAPVAMAQAAPPAAAAPGARRDPFRPLVVKGKGDEIPARLPPGKAGLVVGQLTVQGIVRGLDGRWIAVVDNKTKRAYFLYAGDELYNGSVSRITENSVVFAEKFTDPTGKQSSREVVKQLAR